MAKFSVRLVIMFFPKVDGTFVMDGGIMVGLRQIVDEFVTKTRLFEIVQPKDNQERFLADQYFNLEYELLLGAESPLEIYDKIAELIRFVGVKAWDLGLAEGAVNYRITGNANPQ